MKATTQKQGCESFTALFVIMCFAALPFWLVVTVLIIKNLFIWLLGR